MLPRPLCMDRRVQSVDVHAVGADNGLPLVAETLLAKRESHWQLDAAGCRQPAAPEDREAPGFDRKVYRLCACG
jgi:hypothetical protein